MAQQKLFSITYGILIACIAFTLLGILFFSFDRYPGTEIVVALQLLLAFMAIFEIRNHGFLPATSKKTWYLLLLLITLPSVIFYVFFKRKEILATH